MSSCSFHLRLFVSQCTDVSFWPFEKLVYPVIRLSESSSDPFWSQAKIPWAMTSICGESYQIFHLSVILSLKSRFCRKTLHFYPPQNPLGKKKSLRGSEEREERGRGNLNDGSLIFTRCWNAQWALFDWFKVPRVWCWRGQEGSNPGSDLSYSPRVAAIVHNALHIPTSDRDGWVSLNPLKRTSRQLRKRLVDVTSDVHAGDIYLVS